MRKARCKLLPTLLLAGVLALAGIGGGYAFARPQTAYADGTGAVLPVPVTTTNVARGKTAEMRSLTDFSQQIPVYSYYPNGAATAFPDVEGSGQYALSDTAALTDGEATDWAGYRMRSTAPGTRGWVYLDLGKTQVLDRIKLHMCAAWVFWDVIVQASDSADFTSNVTTVFSSVDSLEADGQTVYNGGKAGLTTDTKSLTGWNGGVGVDSHMMDGNIFPCEGVSARYVRVTNNSLGKGNGQGGATYETVFTEVEVYAIDKGLPPVASLKSGYYEELGSVTLTTPYENAEIYYTLDGSYPTVNATKYTGAVDLSGVTPQCVLRAVAATDEWQSLPADYQYKVGAPSANGGNLARGKTAELRSLADFSQKLDAYIFHCDFNGIDKTGVYPLTNAANGIGRLTDGVVNDYMNWNAVSTFHHVQGWAFLDLGGSYELSSVKLHLYASWNFFDLIIQVSDDPTFRTGVTTVFSEVQELKSRTEGRVTPDSVLVYDGGYVGTENVTLGEWGGIGKYGDSNGKYLSSNQANGHTFACAAGTKGRYVRVTNRILPDFHQQAVFNTVFTEIEVYAKNTVEMTDLPVQEAVKNTDYSAKTLTVPYNTTLAAVKEELNLPASMALTDYSGNNHNVALTWNDPADYSQTTAGTYVFTASYTLPANVTDAFGVLTNVKATVTLKEKTDTAELEAAIASAEALTEADYTTASWQVLQEKLTAAREAANNLSVTEQEASAALQDLQDAVAALARVASAAEKAALQEVINEAKALDPSLYTAASLADLNDAIEAAETVYAAESSSTQVAAAKGNLEKILAAKKEKASAAQTGALDALITTVKEAAYSVNDYTQASVAAVEDAVEAAETLLAGTDLAAEAVTAAKTALEEAVQALVSYGNATELNAAIVAAEALTEADYTASSYATLTAAVTAAKGVAEQKRVQAEYNAAKEDLQAAVDGLVSVVALKEAIAAAVPEEGKEYTALSLQVLADAKVEAQTVLNKADATKEEIAAAVTKLNDAKTGLTLKPAPIEDDDDTQPAQTPGKKKGCKGTLCGSLGALGALLMCGAVVLLQRKKREGK